MLGADFNKDQPLHLLKKHIHSKADAWWQAQTYLIMKFNDDLASWNEKKPFFKRNSK